MHMHLLDATATKITQTGYSGTFANCKCEELSYPKNVKMCDPILVTLSKKTPL